MHNPVHTAIKCVLAWSSSCDVFRHGHRTTRVILCSNGRMALARRGKSSHTYAQLPADHEDLGAVKPEVNGKMDIEA